MKEYIIKINGNQYDVSVQNNHDASASVVVNGSKFHVEHENVEVKKATSFKPVIANVATQTAQVAQTPAPAASTNSGAESHVKSPLPGTILTVNVKEGDKIKVGDRLLMLEAMKMENNIDADKDGVVTKLHVQMGDSVLEGALLVTIQ